MKETYNYEASEGMILIGVPQDLRDLNYDSASEMAQIKQAVIVGDDKPDLTARAFNADYKEYAEITMAEAIGIKPDTLRKAIYDERPMRGYHWKYVEVAEDASIKST